MLQRLVIVEESKKVFGLGAFCLLGKEVKNNGLSKMYWSFEFLIKDMIDNGLPIDPEKLCDEGEMYRPPNYLNDYT